MTSKVTHSLRASVAVLFLSTQFVSAQSNSDLLTEVDFASARAACSGLETTCQSTVGGLVDQILASSAPQSEKDVQLIALANLIAQSSPVTDPSNSRASFSARVDAARSVRNIRNLFPSASPVRRALSNIARSVRRGASKDEIAPISASPS